MGRTGSRWASWLLASIGLACNRPDHPGYADAHDGAPPAAAPKLASPAIAEGGPPTVGELTVGQGKAPYAVVRLAQDVVHLTLRANGFFDWARSNPDLSKLGLADVQEFELELPRPRCRFSAEAPSVHACLLIAAPEAGASTLRVRFPGASDPARPVLELGDVPVGAGPRVVVLDESLVYERVTSAAGERRSWVLTVAMTIQSGPDVLSFRHVFSSEDKE
jgi:hypothetical protein